MRNATLFSDLPQPANDAEDLCEVEFEASSDAAELSRGGPRVRRGYSLLKGRRTRFQARRRTGKMTPETPVHRGEREIIARD